jgi:hypothetical protein
MELELKRIAKRDTYTIGRLSINGQRFCDTLEDTDRGLDQKMSLAVLKARKRKGITAIPTGRYKVTLGVKSPKYSKRPAYNFCEGYVPRLINVPAYEGVLIHIGNYPQDTEGCILVGRNTKVGAVLNSTETFKQLYAILQKATDNIYITIK